MALSAGTVYVDVRPDLSGFQAQVKTAMHGAMSGISSEADKAGRTIGQRLGDSLNAASSRLRSFGQSAMRSGGLLTAGMTLPLAALGKQAIDAASDLNESQSKVGVVFGRSARAIEDFASTSATNLGISRQAALEASGTFGNLFTAMGLGQAPAADLSKQVVTLGSDLASFNNLSPEETLDKLRSGLVGEIEPLRSLGVNFNAAQVEAKAMQLGLADANGEVSESAKVQARMALILEQTTAAQGDFARTSDGVANRQRIAKAEIANAAATIGKVLLPIVQKVVGFVADLAEKFSHLSPTTQKVILVVAALAAALGPVVGIVGAAATVIGFLITPVGLVVAAIAALVAGLIYAYFHFEGFRKVVDAVGRFLRDKVWPAIQVGARAVIDAFQWLWEKAQQVWPTIQNIISTAWSIVQPILKAYWWYITNVLIPVFQRIWSVIQFVFPIVVSIIQAAWSYISFILRLWWAYIQDVLIPVFKLLWSAVSFVFGLVVDSIRSAWDLIKPVLQAFWNFIDGPLKTVWEGFIGAARKAWDTVGNIISSALRGIGNVVSGFLGVVAGIADVVGLDHVRDVLRNAADAANGWGEARGGGGVGQRRAEPARAGFASGGVLPIGKGFKTSGAQAIVGEGRRQFPEFVIPTDPRYRSNALNLMERLGFELFAGGGILGTGMGPHVGPDIVGGARRLVGGLASAGIEHLWPLLPVLPGLAGLPGASINKVRQAVIDFIKGNDTGGGGISGPGGGDLLGVLRQIQQMGFRVTEHPAFGGVTPGAHTTGSYHYRGRAGDINWYPAAGEPSKLDELFGWIRSHVQGIKELLWRVPGHFDHLHLAMANGGIVKHRPGGVMANIGEGRYDEAVVPLDGRLGNTVVHARVFLGTREITDIVRVEVDNASRSAEDIFVRGVA